jgi:glycosyltransferase involved in cell wall biosynthesis
VTSTDTPATSWKAAEFSERRLRVLHLNSGNLYGGVETMLLTMARHRDPASVMEHHFGLCQQGRLSRELEAIGRPVRLLGEVRISRPWTVWRARRCLRELLRQAHFDVVICHMPWSLLVFGDTVRETGQTLGFWAHSLHDGRGWLERFARRVKPDLAIGNSRYTETGLARLFPDVPRGVIYPPVELNTSAQTEDWRSMVRKQQGVAADTVVIIQVSRMEAWKGHLLHFRALSRLKNIDGWVCWIAGGPQKNDEEAYFRLLKKQANELGIADRVKFLGHRSDVPQLLSAADIFCQPNLKPEPFGIVYIESLWASRPVVTTDMGGAAEIIDESCGVLVEPDNPASLAESLRRLIESPELRGRLGKAGAAKARQLCDPAAQMNKLKDLTQTLISRAGRAPKS